MVQRVVIDRQSTQLAHAAAVFELMRNFLEQRPQRRTAEVIAGHRLPIQPACPRCRHRLARFGDGGCIQFTRCQVRKPGEKGKTG